MQFSSPADIMRRALTLAEQGRGYVEPNPPVGAVIVDRENRLVSEGFHARYGGPHAEAAAISAADEIPADAKIYVTLEPCAHHGKTPPCAEAILQAGIRRVVIGCPDPATHLERTGCDVLREAGVTVEVGLLGEDAERLIRPFRKLQLTGLPYIHAKWAMTLDGKIATRTGSSQWISNEASRAYVHHLRGLMDGIVVGRGTAAADDPQLTARPPGPRQPTRIIFDSRASLSLESRLLKTLEVAPLIVICCEDAPSEKLKQLESAGVDLILAPNDEAGYPTLEFAMKELGTRKMTNLLVEGGAALLGSFLDLDQIDEVHTFIAPKLVGGKSAAGPVGGTGIPEMSEAISLKHVTTKAFEDDVYLHGLVGDKSYEGEHL